MKPLRPLAAAGVLLLGLCAGSDAQPKIVVVNLDKVNTAADDLDPFTADGATLYYASNVSGTFGIYQSTVKKRQPGGNKETWSKREVYAGLLDNKFDQRSPFLRKDDLYYAANPVVDPKFAKLKNFDVFQKAGPLAPFHLLGISEKTDETHPWIADSGKEFYFSRNTAKGWKLFVANGPSPGPIGNAKEVGFPVGFRNATLSEKDRGLVMYLQGPLEDGREGLYRSERKKVGAAWDKPEPLKQVNNAMGKVGDITPCITADGKRLFFASDRPGGVGRMDIWYVFTSQLKLK
jgi:hypothetical protein